MGEGFVCLVLFLNDGYLKALKFSLTPGNWFSSVIGI